MDPYADDLGDWEEFKNTQEMTLSLYSILEEYIGQNELCPWKIELLCRDVIEISLPDGTRYWLKVTRKRLRQLDCAER